MMRLIYSCDTLKTAYPLILFAHKIVCILNTWWNVLVQPVRYHFYNAIYKWNYYVNFLFNIRNTKKKNVSVDRPCVCYGLLGTFCTMIPLSCAFDSNNWRVENVFNFYQTIWYHLTVNLLLFELNCNILSTSFTIRNIEMVTWEVQWNEQLTILRARIINLILIQTSKFSLIGM